MRGVTRTLAAGVFAAESGLVESSWALIACDGSASSVAGNVPSVTSAFLCLARTHLFDLRHGLTCQRTSESTLHIRRDWELGGLMGGASPQVWRRGSPLSAPWTPRTLPRTGRAVRHL